MKVYLVGVGAGKPDLITVRGQKILRQADVILYDYLLDPGILNEVKDSAEVISCQDLGKKPQGQMQEIQNLINNLMVKKAKEGKLVVRLKNGDPALFSRCTEELNALVENGINFEIVPGVTAASVASAYSGIPLTDRELASSATFVTGHENLSKNESYEIDWSKIAGSPTIVLYMAVSTIAKIAHNLISYGKPESTPVAVISHIASMNQKTVISDLSHIDRKVKDAGIEPPAIFIIGDVVNFENKFNWFKNTRKVLYTGISDERFFYDALFFHLPLIKILPLDNYDEFDSYLKKIPQLDWIIFTSRYSVYYFFKRFFNLGFDARGLSGLTIAAIGSSTNNSLADYGISADLIPQQESSEGLLHELKKINLTGKKVLVPRSDLSDKGLTEELEMMGAAVCAPVAYKNVMPDDLPEIDFSFFDEICFTSPSIVRNFITRYKKVPSHCKITCIGEVTLKEARKWSLI